MSKKDLYDLIHEYWIFTVKDIKPINQNPINMNRLSFFGFYEWLKEESEKEIVS